MLGYDRIGIDLEELLSFAQKNWSVMDQDTREIFRNSFYSHIKSAKEVAQFLDIFETYFICNGDLTLFYMINRIYY